jgi:hypothetical protein
VTIIYDGDGNRVLKTVGGVTTNYLVDTNNLTGYAQVVEELEGGIVVKAYTYGHDLISQRVAGEPGQRITVTFLPKNSAMRILGFITAGQISRRSNEQIHFAGQLGR